MRLDVPGCFSVEVTFVAVLIPVDPCNWEPGRGVPGCRGGLRPALCCLLRFADDVSSKCGPLYFVSPSHLQNGLRPN